MLMKNSRTRYHWAASALLPLAALLAWVLVLSLAHQAAPFMALTSVRYGEGEGKSPAQLVREERYAREDGSEDLPAQTLWREQKDQQLTDETAFRFTGVSLLTCFGSGDDLYPAAFRFGAMPIRGDTEGIALSVAAANALWGGVGAPGQAVKWNDKTYYLRGVFESDTPLAVVQDEENSEELYPNLLVDGPRVGGGTTLDLPFLSWLLTAMAGLPGLLLALALLARILGRGWKLRFTPILLTRYFPAALLGCAATLWAAGFPWDIPAKLIPTRFSDLDFWGRLAGEVAGGVTGVLTSSMTARDLALWTPVLFCLLALPVACALTLAALRRAGADSLNALLAKGLSAMVITYGAAMALGVNLSYSVLALPVLWLTVDLALKYHQKKLQPVGQGLAPAIEGEESLC